MRTAIEDIEYGLRRNLGGMVAGREPYAGQFNRFNVAGRTGLDPMMAARIADAQDQNPNTSIAPLPMATAPISRLATKLKRSSITDPQVARFAGQGGEENPFSRGERNALLAPYGTRIDQPVEE